MGDQTRAKGRFDGKHCGLLDSALHLARDADAIAMARWQLGRSECFSSHVFRKLVLHDYPAVARPAMPLEYYAKGAGVLFVRESWDDDAAYVYFTAGIRDEAHQCEDQGGFAVWDDGQWQTVADHPWTQYGICSVKPVDGARLATQNVLGEVQVSMDLSESVGRAWTREVRWLLGTDIMQIDDQFEGEAVFGFEVPSEDDERVTVPLSNATVTVGETDTGLSSAVEW